MRWPLAKLKGHEVLRLAPYNCDLTPIEIGDDLGDQMKGYVRQHKAGCVSEVQELVEEAVEQIAPSAWASCCDHVSKVEDMYWKSDKVMDELESFVINLGSDDSTYLR